MRFRRKFFAKALLFVVFIALMGWVVMRLWNWVVPGLGIEAHAIDFPHAIGLLVLCRILFGGFRGHGGGCSKRRQWQHWQQWQRMTQQERDTLRNEMPPRANGAGESSGA